MLKTVAVLTMLSISPTQVGLIASENEAIHRRLACLEACGQSICTPVGVYEAEGCIRRYVRTDYKCGTEEK